MIPTSTFRRNATESSASTFMAMALHSPDSPVTGDETEEAEEDQVLIERGSLPSAAWLKE